MKKDPAAQIASLAAQERARILRRDILAGEAVPLYPMAQDEAGRELEKFASTLLKTPGMDGYFDRRHFVNLKENRHEAHHGFATLKHGGILEILSIPSLPENAAGFHIYAVFDPRDQSDRGKYIGYAIYSLEKGSSPFGQADAVRLAFDIFPDFRHQRYKKVRFTTHEIYNVSRRILCQYKPKVFLVDAQTQIRHAQTADPFIRAIYYLKRGYYPPDQKPLADACLIRLAKGQRLGRKSVNALLRGTTAPFWVFPACPSSGDCQPSKPPMNRTPPKDESTD